MDLIKSFLSVIVISFVVFCIPAFGIDVYGPVPPGYPNASTTGLAGVGLTEGDLTPYGGAGAMDITTPGAIIELMDIPNGVIINADNVTIRKCKIGINDDPAKLYAGVEVVSGTEGAVVEDCLMMSDSLQCYGDGRGISGENFIIRRCDISQYPNGVKTKSNTITEDNYIHDLVRLEGCDQYESHYHNSSYSTGSDSNAIVRRNTFRGCLGAGTSILLISGTGDINNFFYEYNLLGGGTACVNMNDEPTLGYYITNVTFRRNVWEVGTYDLHLYYGSTPLAELPTFICNTYDDGTYLADNDFPCDYVAADAGPDQVIFDTDGDAEETVTLDGSGSHFFGEQIGYGAHIVSYVWEANGIEIATGVTADVNLGMGLNLVTLEVTDVNALTDTDVVEIIVTSDSPPATPIEFDANSYGAASLGGSSFSWSHTIGDGNDRVLVVGLAIQDVGTVDMNVASITYDGVSMTATPNSIATESTGNVIRSQQFYMLDSNLPSAGTYLIDVVFDGQIIDGCGGGVSMKNVSQQQPQVVVTNTESSGVDSINTILTTQIGYSWLVDTVVATAMSGSFEPNDPCMAEYWNKDLFLTSAAGSTKLVSYVGDTKASWIHSTGSARMAHSVAVFAPIIGQLKAYNPMPQDEEPSVATDTILTWSPGDYAAMHDVFLGTDFDDVNDAYRHFCDLDGSGQVDVGDVGVMVSQWLDPEGSADLDDMNGVDFVDFAILNANWAEFSSLEFMASLTVDANSFDPCGLDAAQPYFWRVDEVNDLHDDSPWTGDVWRFTTQ